jgi:hypothetical protein
MKILTKKGAGGHEFLDQGEKFTTIPRYTSRWAISRISLAISTALRYVRKEHETGKANGRDHRDTG